MMPRSSGGSLTPSIENVFPVPVWPYAKMVPLKPSRTESTMGIAVFWYRSACCDRSSNTMSKVKAFGGSELPGACTETLPILASIWTMVSRPSARSVELSGRQRTTTLTASSLRPIGNHTGRAKRRWRAEAAQEHRKLYSTCVRLNGRPVTDGFREIEDIVSKPLKKERKQNPEGMETPL